MPTASLVVEVAMGKGPFDVLEAGDWTDLSDRVLEFHRRAGRDDQRSEFDPATIMVRLDNDDRLLDPDYPSALNYRGDELGMPLAPVRVTIDYDGDNYPLFFGYLGPECWEGETARVGPGATVVLNAFDRYGLFLQLDGPGGVWEVIVAYLAPDWWITGTADFPFLDDGSEIPNTSPVGGAAEVSAGVGEIVAIIEPGLTDGSLSNLAMLLGEDVEVVSPAALVMPDGASDDGTAIIFWKGTPASETQRILRMESTGGTLRWEVGCSTAGEIACSIYDSGGTLTNLVAADPNPADGGGRWDDDAPHFIVVRITGGDVVELFVDGSSVEMDSPPLDQVRTSNLIAGGSEQPMLVDEILWWNRALSDAELSVPTIMVGVGRGPFRGDTLPQRLAHLYRVNGLDPTDDEDEWHTGADDGDYSTGMWELSSSGTLGNDLGQAVASWGGTLWATRSGRIRARSITALTNPAHAAEYATPTAHLTDEISPDPTPMPVRRSKITFSGVRGDRITNVVAVGFAYGTGGGFSAPASATLKYSDADSVARYGRRSVNLSTNVAEWPWAALLARLTVERQAQPPIEIGAITLDPLATTDPNPLLWLVTLCELERAVQVTHTPAIGDPVTLLLNVQGEDWDWVGTDLRVTLNLAPS